MTVVQEPVIARVAEGVDVTLGFPVNIDTQEVRRETRPTTTGMKLAHEV
jgi:hypothetical protein